MVVPDKSANRDEVAGHREDASSVKDESSPQELFQKQVKERVEEARKKYSALCQRCLVVTNRNVLLLNVKQHPVDIFLGCAREVATSYFLRK